MVLALLLGGCAASIPRVEHDAQLKAQQEAYEDRLRRAEDERLRASKTCVDERDEARRTAKEKGDRSAELESSLADKQRTLDDVTTQLLELQDAFSKLSSKERTQVESGLASQRSKEAAVTDLKTRLTETLKAELAEGRLELLAKDDVITLRAKDGVLFQKGSSKLLGATKGVVEHLAQAIKLIPDGPVRLEVHTDSVRPKEGDASDTWLLTAQQGLALAAQLSKLGVDPSRLAYTAFGQFRPLATNDTAEGRAANRRVELQLQLPRTR